jgi:siroheme synthase
MGKVYLAGAGLGDPELLTMARLEASPVSEARV